MSFGPSGINSPPEGGEQTPQGGPLRVSRPALRAAPRALPDGGRYAPPAPQGCAPCAPFGARVPAMCRPGRKAVRLFRGIFLKGGPCEARRGVPGGVPPGAVERWATRGRAVGGQWATRSVVHAVHGPQRCPRRNGPQGAAVEAVWLFLTLRTTYRVRSSGPRTRIKPRGERKNKESERKNKEGWRKNKRLFFR